MVVAVGAVVVGQLQFGLLRVAFVAEKGQRVLIFRVVTGTQQLHAQYPGIEINGALQVADAQHGVEDSHGVCFLLVGEGAHRGAS